MKHLSLLLFAALLMACGDTSESTVDHATTEMEMPEATADPGATLQATVDAVQSNGGDITAISGSAAVDNIDAWMEHLEDVDGADKVTGNLESLRETLSASPINGQLAGMQLISLAEDTRQVASSVPGISALVSALQAGGEKLTGAAVSGGGLLDQTLQVAKSQAADITTLPATAAVQNIDGWLGELRGMDGADEIINDLEELKQTLTAPSIDGERASELMFSLAEGTRSVAGDNTGLATLAYLLEAGGYRLQGMSEDK